MAAGGLWCSDTGQTLLRRRAYPFTSGSYAVVVGWRDVEHGGSVADISRFAEYTFFYTLGVRYVHGEGANQYRDRGTYVEVIKSRYGVAPWALTARTNGSLGQQFDRLVEDSRQSGCGRHDHGAGR